MTGAVGYHGGFAAEQIAENAYLEGGYVVLERRWRGEAGEIDLIVRRGDGIRFVEGKKARTHARAAERISQRQWARIDELLRQLRNQPHPAQLLASATSPPKR